MKDRIALSESQEDYLEAIYHIEAGKRAVRATDISERMNVNRSSVTGALHSLSDKGLVNYAPYEVVTLTPKGRAVAKEVVRRHKGLRDFFVKVLHVGAEEADEAACRMEHAVTREIMDRFLDFVATFTAEHTQVRPLGSAEVGAEATVVSLPAGRAAQTRLKHMGLNVGDKLHVLRGGQGRTGPTLVAVGQTRLAIGHGMAGRVMVRLEEGS